MQQGTRIRHLSVAAAGRRGVPMVQSVVEDAFRTQVSAPRDRGLLVVRRIDLGPIAGRRDQVAVNRRLSALMAEALSHAVRFDAPGAATAQAVVFPDPVVPYRAVFRAMGTGRPVPRGWAFRAVFGPVLDQPNAVLMPRLIARIAAAPFAAPAIAQLFADLGPMQGHALAALTVPDAEALLDLLRLPLAAPAAAGPAVPAVAARVLAALGPVSDIAQALRRITDRRGRGRAATPHLRLFVALRLIPVLNRAVTAPECDAVLAALLPLVAARPAARDRAEDAPAALTRPAVPDRTDSATPASHFEPPPPDAAAPADRAPPPAAPPAAFDPPAAPTEAEAPAGPAAAPVVRPARPEASGATPGDVSAAPEPATPGEAETAPAEDQLPVSPLRITGDAPTSMAGAAYLIRLIDRAFGGWLNRPEHLAHGTGQRLLLRMLDGLPTPPEDPLRQFADTLQAPAQDDPPHPLSFALPEELAALFSGPVTLHPVAGHRGWRMATAARGRVVLAVWQGRAPQSVRTMLGALETPPQRGAVGAATPARMLAGCVLALRRWLRRTARLSPTALVCRPGQVAATRTHLDVIFDADLIDLAVRRWALDVSPGWCPWLFRVVTIHYDFGEQDA